METLQSRHFIQKGSQPVECIRCNFHCLQKAAFGSLTYPGVFPSTSSGFTTLIQQGNNACSSSSEVPSGMLLTLTDLELGFPPEKTRLAFSQHLDGAGGVCSHPQQNTTASCIWCISVKPVQYMSTEKRRIMQLSSWQEVFLAVPIKA